MTSGVIAPMTAAMASDVSWNDANPRVCATANARPPGIAARKMRQVSGAFASHAMSSATGTAIQFRAVAIVRAPVSTARTNSGPTPQRSTTSIDRPVPEPGIVADTRAVGHPRIPSHSRQSRNAERTCTWVAHYEPGYPARDVRS